MLKHLYIRLLYISCVGMEQPEYTPLETVTSVPPPSQREAPPGVSGDRVWSMNQEIHLFSGG